MATATKKIVPNQIFQSSNYFIFILEQYLTEQLAASHVEVVLEGLYMPINSSIAQASAPDQAANAMIRLLIDAGLDFEQLHEIYNVKGLPDLELSLRTAFLDKMVGQPRNVVDQVKTNFLY